MKRLGVFLSLLLVLGVAFGQAEVDMYGHSVPLPKNITQLQKGAKKAYAALGRAIEGKYILLAQFKNDIAMSDRLNLKQYGVTVYDNLGACTYFVTVKSDKLRLAVKKGGMLSLFAPQHEWKMSSVLSCDTIPEYAVKDGKIGIMVYYHEAISEKTIKARMKALGLKEAPTFEGKPYYTFNYWLDRKKIVPLAKEIWVKRVRLVYPPATPAE
ncbi:MAG: hypothetical protein ACTTKZ_05170 [Bacteroides sp.]